MTELQSSIIKTLAFFASQSQALTLLELHGWLVRNSPDQRPVSPGAVLSELERGLADLVSCRDGLYYLKAFDFKQYDRHDKYIMSLQLFKKARRWASGLRHVPYVRAAALSGSAAQLNARPSSDIDLLVITAAKRIFFARMLVSAYFQIFGGRRHDSNIVKRFCLNHYIIAGMVLNQDRNLYTALEYVSLIPIFGAPEIEKFQRLNLPWIRQILLQPHVYASPYFSRAQTRGSVVQRVLEIILWPIAELLEAAARRIQNRRIRQSESVIANSQELSFHPESKGQRILSGYDRVLARLNLPGIDK